jgi:serine protease inhibitor
MKSRFPLFKDSKVKAMEMLYQGGEFAMGFILPHSNEDLGMIDVPHYAAKFNECSPEEVEVSIPRFTQEKELNLIPILNRLGVKDLFNMDARLDNLSPDPAFVSLMKHKSVVIVDEKGTEAAAVTIALVMEKCLPREPEKFCLDRPFKYYIRHLPTGMIMMVGDFHGKSN